MNNIAVVLPNWLGDVVMCTPALRALARQFPDATVTAVGKKPLCQVVEGLPYVHRTYPIPSDAGFLDILRAARSIRPFARDLVIVLPHSFRAALLAWCTRSRRRIGYDLNSRGLLLTDRVPPHRREGKREPIYMVDEYMGVVRPLGCEDDAQGPELHADPESLARVKALTADKRPLVGIAPGAAFGPSKRWPVERFAAVADRLHEKYGACCVLMAGPGEDDLRKEIQRIARYPLLEYDDGKPSVALMKAMVSHLDLMVCNDSGPRHVAVAFRVPVVCIMGPTSPRYSEGPYEKGERVRVEVDCSPCQKPVCPIDHRCMTRVTVDRVIASAERFLPR